MRIPEELKYSSDHEWAAVSSNRVRVGITDYAQDALGDVVYVELPKVGTTVSASDAIGEVESTKSVSEIYAPVSGTIVAVNADLGGSPESINQDPYGAGWICEIEVSGDDAVAALLDASAYRDLTAH
jgi:glycine cleavage system H protein